ncbi:Hypothetical_protein [Hexamita inflata]|uniref:Hypothetical_protein n=1 Tax=Hexamita inflata TaxID=28002 RepID=A0AA86ND54_9EUKA|nr:Hypothetical protein HINF_LOCUS4813 [Hexamita inflata]CAI9919964.1 Hypothetical protein HINF_LOCUS7609 [Hexamita inflata]CAI9971977.1 Hypothetical protein HINF_LOCUS59622 [Hexamita inflata]
MNPPQDIVVPVKLLFKLETLLIWIIQVFAQPMTLPIIDFPFIVLVYTKIFFNNTFCPYDHPIPVEIAPLDSQPVVYQNTIFEFKSIISQLREYLSVPLIIPNPFQQLPKIVIYTDNYQQEILPEQCETRPKPTKSVEIAFTYYCIQTYLINKLLLFSPILTNIPKPNIDYASYCQQQSESKLIICILVAVIKYVIPPNKQQSLESN